MRVTERTSGSSSAIFGGQAEGDGEAILGNEQNPHNVAAVLREETESRPNSSDDNKQPASFMTTGCIKYPTMLYSTRRKVLIHF